MTTYPKGKTSHRCFQFNLMVDYHPQVIIVLDRAWKTILPSYVLKVTTVSLAQWKVHNTPAQVSQCLWCHSNFTLSKLSFCYISLLFFVRMFICERVMLVRIMINFSTDQLLSRLFCCVSGGFYNDKTNATSISNCLPCPARKYCPQGSTNEGLDCPAGFWCTAMQASPYQNACPIGTFGSIEGLESEFCFIFHQLFL